MEDSSTIKSATYAKLFPEQLADKCSSGALESNSGPIAYLYALYQQALELESTSVDDDRLLLADRRPDIPELLLSSESLNKPVSALALAIKALTRQAEAHIETSKHLPEEIAQAQCSAGLPFHYPLAQTLAVLRQKKLPFFELLQTCEYTFPNFCYDNLRTRELRQVMRTATGFSPALQNLLLDDTLPSAENYLQDRFGDIEDDGLAQLMSVEFLCRKTGLKPDEIFDLLALSGVADEAKTGFTSVKRSSAYMPGTKTPIDGRLYGAVFINNGCEPALTLEDTLTGPGITLAIKGADAGHFGRIHKLIHLQRALELPFAEVDLLLMSALRAEGQTNNFRITENTLRALGVFRFLNEAYDLGAEPFAALIHEVSPYSTGERMPFLDRILDGPGVGQLAQVGERLIIDDSAFAPGDASTLAHLGKALGMDRRLVDAYLNQATTALGLSKPTRSLSLLTPLYRLSRLPRLLRLSPKDGDDFIALLRVTNAQGINILAGKGRINSDVGEPDTLDALIAAANLARWLQREQIIPQALLKVLAVPAANPAPEEEQCRFDTDSKIRTSLNDTLPYIEKSLLSEDAIVEAVGGTCELRSGNWLTILTDYRSMNGVLKPFDPMKLGDQLQMLLEGKLTDPAHTPTAVSLLSALLIDKQTAQEKVTQQAISAAFNKDSGEGELSALHVLPMLRWANLTTNGVLTDIVNASESDLVSSEKNASPLSGLPLGDWSKLTRYVSALRLAKLSPLGLEALLTHPEWFALEAQFSIDESDITDNRRMPPELSLDLLYQLTRYRAWVETCRQNRYEENDALNYLESATDSTQPNAIKTAARQLGKLIGWEESEVYLAMPQIAVPVQSESNAPPKSIDQFVASLSAARKKCYSYAGYFDVEMLLRDLYSRAKVNDYDDSLRRYTAVQFNDFLESCDGPLKVTQAQYNMGNYPDYFQSCRTKLINKKIKPLAAEVVKLEIYTPTIIHTQEQITCAPDTLADIELILRFKANCEITGLSCQTLLQLADIDLDTQYTEFEEIAALVLAACDEDTSLALELQLQEQWRDALVQWLLAYWVSDVPEMQAFISNWDDLSTYFLTDIGVTRTAAKTTLVTQAISSLQHYLHRLISHLEPGYETGELPPDAIDAWQQYLSQYGSWKKQQAQINHPENLIHYANRPQKTLAFQELETEINQGRLGTAVLHTAIRAYLTKFERLSNLQVVSGYLEGGNPKSGTYHLIGKTNTSPTEYYWRTVDMSLRDDKERLSPLAWSEWKKIGISPAGQLTQSRYIRNTDAFPFVEVFTCYSLRPVVIAGRRYVFWAERDSTEMRDASTKKPTANKKISVLYAFQQSDGFWSTANEFMRLDGTVEGKRLTDIDANRLKDETYIPGLIVFINEEGARKEDPWLTVILYNCDHIGTKDAPIGERNKDYFVEMRDLLLVDSKTNMCENIKLLTHVATSSYRDVRIVQHAYDGQVEHMTAESVAYKKKSKRKVSEPFAFTGKNIEFQASTGKSANEVVITIGTDGTIYCKKNEGTEYSPLDFKLEVQEPGSKDYKTVETLKELTGRKLKQEVTYFAPNEGSYTFRASITLTKKLDKYPKGNISIESYCKYRITKIKKDELWNILIVRNLEQAQFLDMTSVSDQYPPFPSNHIRLNTLFGKQLVARASEGIEKVLDWSAQMLREPTIDSEKPNPNVDFHGANGLYFRELFLHLPALIATRLTEQQQFEDAERWYLRHLFNPYRSTNADDELPAWWNSRPLAEVGTLKSELSRTVPPISRAFVLSRYYQQAIYLSLVENWLKQGDHYYRQLKLSTLNHAWLSYQQALKLIGPLPERFDASRWSPVVLSEVSESNFRLPINPRLISIRKTLESRIYNLRHGLTLDGTSLPTLGWGEETAEPFASASHALAIVPHSYKDSRAAIPAYRFRQLLPAARSSAQQLLDLGRHYMKLVEDEFNTSLSVLIKSQEIRISEFTERLQQEAINSVIAHKRGLEASLRNIEAKKSWYETLLKEGKSHMEEAATVLAISAKTYELIAGPVEIAAGGIAALMPTIYGMAMGGNRPEQPLLRMAAAIKSGATAMNFASSQLLTEAGYQRRASQWQFDLRQAERDIGVIKLEIAETNIDLNAATIALESCKTARTNLREIHTVMTTAFNRPPVYNWLVARQELIYGAAYDAVLSLCLTLEAAWRYEIGDYQRTAFIKPSAWSDSYRGMLVGESLLVDLQEMENAYLMANERRLTVSKSFSLKTLLEEDEWNSRTAELKLFKPLKFELKAKDFDQSYPGHYLRQIKHVSVSFILNKDSKLQDISAILRQVSNSTLVQPDKEAIEVFYKDPRKATASVRRNLRAQQQIALSSLVNEDGLGYNPGEWVYELMFHDGRYLPFEGTGAISEWELEVTDTAIAKKLADEVTDIRINVVYTAKSGSAEFTAAVKKLLNAK